MHLSITNVVQILFLNEENGILLGLGFKFGRCVTPAHVACCLTKVMVFSAVWDLGMYLVISWLKLWLCLAFLSAPTHTHTHLSVLTFNSEHIAHAMAVAAAVRLIPELGMQQLWLLQLSRC